MDVLTGGLLTPPLSAIRYLTFYVLLFHSPVRLLYVHRVSNVETRIRRARGIFRILILCLSYCSFISRFYLARLLYLPWVDRYVPFTPFDP